METVDKECGITIHTRLTLVNDTDEVIRLKDITRLFLSHKDLNIGSRRDILVGLIRDVIERSSNE